jgi:hypothetical protein
MRKPADIAWLQELLDRSRGKASEHLQSIISPDRAVPARDLVERLRGMRTLALSTVSPAGRPRISGVDGHLLRGRWIFSTGRYAQVRAITARLLPCPLPLSLVPLALLPLAPLPLPRPEAGASPAAINAHPRASPAAGSRASSISSTGMSSRTG